MRNLNIMIPARHGKNATMDQAHADYLFVKRNIKRAYKRGWRASEPRWRALWNLAVLYAIKHPKSSCSISELYYLVSEEYGTYVHELMAQA